MSDDIKNEDRKKVLVIDDTADVREPLFTALAAAGYEVLLAENGEKGIESALAEHPDLILLDLAMPIMDGHEVLKTLREDAWGKNAKIIVLTASADLDTLSQTLEMGGMDYMVKTDWKLDDIVAKIRSKIGV